MKPLIHDQIPLIWVTSYPKSGNTWIRNFLYRYLWQEPDVNIGNRSFTLDRLMRDAEEAGVSVDTHLERKHLTDISPTWPTEVSERALLKTHYEWTHTHPLRDKHGASLLIIRDPKDVMISAWNFRQLRNREIASDPRTYVEAFIRNQGDPGYVRRGYGTWLSQPLSWISQAREQAPTIVVGYRSLLMDGPLTFRNISNAVFGEVDEHRLSTAYEGSRFTSLQQREIDRLKKQGKDTSKLFFNSGKTGQSIQNSMGVELDVEFDLAFREPIERLKGAILNCKWAIDCGSQL